MGTLVEWSDITVYVMARAWIDEAFRRALMTDSRVALKTYFNYDVPEGVNVVVTEGATTGAVGVNHLSIGPRPADLSDGRIEVLASPDAHDIKGYLCCICC